MLTAAFAGIGTISLMALCAASCGGGSGGASEGGVAARAWAGVALVPRVRNPEWPFGAAAITPSAPPPKAPPSGTTASLWLGNVTTIGTAATVSQSAPTANFAAWIKHQRTVATTYYIDGSYSNHGIASIQGTVVNGAVSFTVQFRSPASLGVGIYSDTITLEGMLRQRLQQPDSRQSVEQSTVTYTVQADPVTLTGISPSGVVAGSAGFTLTLTGTDFSKNSIVIFNQYPQPTTFVSPTQLTASIGAPAGHS